MKTRSKSLLASWIIGALYFVYITLYFLKVIEPSETVLEDIVHGIALMLVGPHIFLVFLALIFNIIGWAKSVKWAALTGGILYCVAALAFIMYCFFVIPSIVLSFVGFATLNGPQSNKAPSPEKIARSNLFDQIIPPDSVREKLFLALCAVLSFCGTICGLYFIFA